MNLIRCRCCGEWKALESFPVRRDLVVPVPRSECKNCRREQQNLRRGRVSTGPYNQPEWIVSQPEMGPVCEPVALVWRIAA